MQVSFYVRFRSSAGFEDYCFRHAAQRAVKGEKVEMEIEESPSWGCRDCADETSDTEAFKRVEEWRRGDPPADFHDGK